MGAAGEEREGRLGVAAEAGDCGECAPDGLEVGGGEALARWLGCRGVGPEVQAGVREGGVFAAELSDMSAQEAAEALAISIDTARPLLRCLKSFAARHPFLPYSPSQEGESGGTSTRLAPSSPPPPSSELHGFVDEEPAIVIKTPVEGETVLVAAVAFEVLHVPRWEECCMVEVLLDTSAPGLLVPVAVARHPSALPVAVDRNRTAHPHGPSWHTLLLRLVHSDDPNGPPLAEASRRIRFTGPRKISMEKTLTASGVEGEAGGRTGRRFPETSPDVCCAFLSRGRVQALGGWMAERLSELVGGVRDIVAQVW